MTTKTKRLTITCSGCQKVMRVPAKLVGKSGACPRCGKRLKVHDKTVAVPKRKTELLPPAAPVEAAPPALPPVQTAPAYWQPQPAAQPAAAQQNVVVNVNTPEQPGNLCATLSCVFGAVALCMCWVPFVGALAGLVGCGLSVVGFWVGVFRFKGIFVSICGWFFSAAAVWFGVLSTLAFIAVLGAAGAASGDGLQDTTTNPPSGVIRRYIET